MTPIQSTEQQTRTFTEEKPTGCSWGRVFSKIASTAIHVAKIAAVFSMSLPALALPIYMNPGQVLVRHGTASCGINKIAFSPELCHEITTWYLASLYNPSFHAKYTEKDLAQHHEKGISRKGEDGTTFRFLIPLKRLENYQIATHYAKAAFTLQSWHESPKMTLDRIFNLHRIIRADPLEPNSYRMGHKVLNSFFHTDDAKIDHGQFTDPERAILTKTHPAQISTLPAEEAAVWLKILFIPTTQPSEIADQMEHLVTELHRRMQQGGDYVDHASFFHAEFTRIQPFYTGVGRIARLMVDVILDAGELPPVVFNDDIEYTNAVRQGTTNRAIFTEYLRKSIAWTKENLPDVDNSAYRRIVNETRVMYPGQLFSNVGRQLDGKKADPKAYHNYQRALDHLQQHNIMNMNAEEFVKLIKSLHILLTQDIDPPESSSFGGYRSSYMLVNDMTAITDIITKAQSLLGDRFQFFLQSISKIQNDINHLGQLSEEEKELWRELTHLPTAPEKIAQEMLTFARNFVRRRDEHYLDLAAFVHMEFARIWPFSNGNSRLGRMLMNECLRQNGKKFITFPNRNQYQQVVHKALDDYAVFTDYLKRII